jgi:TfoX/Sxy family transcriptional regulator of competence genes
MSTSQATIDFILDQVEGAGEVRARKMFGEYALYCDEKVVALVCDDTLYIKITEPGREFVGSHYAEGAPYPGAKPHMQIGDDLLDDRQWLSELIRLTADTLPAPKKKAKKKRSR